MWNHLSNWRPGPRAVLGLLAGLAGAWPGALGAAGAKTYSLTECLDLAARQNPDVLAAAKRVDAASAGVVQAKAGIFPALTSSAFYQRREQSVATNDNLYPTYRKDDYVADVRVTQNVYSAGAVRARIAVAILQQKAAALDYKTALDSAALLVRTAYYQTLYAQELIGVRQQAIDLLNAQVKDQQDRYTAGSVGQLNVNRVQVSLANEEPALADARYQVHAGYVALSQALAIPFADGAAEPGFAVRGALAYEPMKLSLNECLTRADAARPEIASKQLAVDALRRQVTVEKSATRPQLSAFAAYDLYSEPDIRADTDHFSGYTIGVSATWQIFDGFQTLGKVRGARAQVAVAEAALASMRLQVEAEVRAAFYERQSAEETLRPETANIRLAHENQDLSTKNFGVGLSSQLEVLQSRVDLTRAETTELLGRESFNLARAKLLRAMGVAQLDAVGGSGSLPPAGK